VVLESAEAFQLRKPGVSYHIDCGLKNDDIGSGFSGSEVGPRQYTEMTKKESYFRGTDRWSDQANILNFNWKHSIKGGK
jgi:hypothetical protein